MALIFGIVTFFIQFGYLHEQWFNNEGSVIEARLGFTAHTFLILFSLILLWGDRK
jgi:hypothetical protein